MMIPCAARGMQLFGDCGVEGIVREVLQQLDLPLAGFCGRRLDRAASDLRTPSPPRWPCR